MDDDAHDERFRSYEDILRSLTAMLVRQDAINEDLRECTRQHVEINRDVKTTLARIETRLARMLGRDGNGTDA